MIKEVSGDILLTDSKTIVNCVAPMDHFDSGLALSLRENYPAMVKGFRNYCHTHHPKPGEIWTWSGVGGIRIVNLMAQEPAPSESYKGHPGNASLGNLEKTFKNLVKFFEKEKPQSIAIPKLATGVGGLEWEDVRQFIYRHLDGIKIPVFVYTTYTKGMKAREEFQ